MAAVPANPPIQVVITNLEFDEKYSISMETLHQHCPGLCQWMAQCRFNPTTHNIRFQNTSAYVLGTFETWLQDNTYSPVTPWSIRKPSEFGKTVMFELDVWGLARRCGVGKLQEKVEDSLREKLREPVYDYTSKALKLLLEEKFCSLENKWRRELLCHLILDILGDDVVNLPPGLGELYKKNSRLWEAHSKTWRERNATRPTRHVSDEPKERGMDFYTSQVPKRRS